jgi:hypothetical protein
MIQNIWSLSKLIHCNLDILVDCEYTFISPRTISPSIEYLYIMRYVCNLNQLLHLFEFTPRLRHFSTIFESDIEDERILSSIPLINRLDLTVNESPYAMMHLLHNVPNLSHLTIKTVDIIINGHVWEKLIVKYLIKLNVFRLHMFSDFPNDDSKEQRIEELVNTFRTPFWLEERHWYIRCDWDRCLRCDTNIHLYTLTYPNRDLSQCQRGFRSKTTCPNVNDAWTFKDVHKLEYFSHPSNELVSPYLPLDDNFWCSITNFDELTSLIISSPGENVNSLNFEQIQVILDRAPRLNSLSFRLSSLESERFLTIQLIHQSIRQLHLEESDHFFDDQQCYLLSQSPLGIQCEILSIMVQNRTNVIDLLNTMINLRVLNVYCQDDRYIPEQSSSSFNDELIQWLKDHLSSTCTISRDKNDRYTSQFQKIRTILIWIR